MIQPAKRLDTVQEYYFSKKLREVRSLAAAGKPIINRFHKREDVPATTALSDKIAQDLKKRGFKFVGSTVIYAYIQAIGLVNDHSTDCYKYPAV